MTAATSKMELWKLFTIIIKRSISHVAAVLDPPHKSIKNNNSVLNNNWNTCYDTTHLYRKSCCS